MITLTTGIKIDNSYQDNSINSIDNNNYNNIIDNKPIHPVLDVRYSH